MDMGVFVGHKIYWREPNLTSGDKSLQDEFVNNIKDSINYDYLCQSLDNERELFLRNLLVYYNYYTDIQKFLLFEAP